eukprot:m.125932 g.125932  ORF g.125932 m.125932 type:complete len:65 (+) comp29166_c0_seq3:400-594(+)
MDEKIVPYGQHDTACTSVREKRTVGEFTGDMMETIMYSINLNEILTDTSLPHLGLLYEIACIEV